MYFHILIKVKILIETGYIVPINNFVSITNMVLINNKVPIINLVPISNLVPIYCTQVYYYISNIGLISVSHSLNWIRFGNWNDMENIISSN